MVRSKITNNLEKVLKLYKESKSNGLLMYEPRKIEIINTLDNKQIKSES